MRRVDLHAYLGTDEWIASQGPYVEPLGRYLNRQWTAKSEDEVAADFVEHGVEAVLVAFDIQSVTGACLAHEEQAVTAADEAAGDDAATLRHGCRRWPIRSSRW